MRTGSPASAARKAALSAMLRMLPPATLSRASLPTSRPSVGVSAREDAPPDLGALRGVGKGELNDEADAPQKRRVERALHIGRQDRQTAIGFHPLQQIADLDVGVTVVAVLDLAAFAEQRVGLVEEQDGAAVFRGVEDAPQVLFGLADVLADHLAEIDAIEIEPQFVGEHFGGHRLAGAAGAGEERADAQSACAF